MKAKFIVILATLFIIIGCDSPRSSRAYLASSSSLGTNFTNPSATATVTVTSSPSTSGSSSSNGVTIPTDINSDCTFSTDGTNNFSSTSTHAGSYTLCRSTSNPNSFYFQLKTPPTDANGNNVQVCFVPMTSNNGNSIYIGNPMCGNFTSNLTIKKITFVKYNSYSNATINSVMFFKDTSYYYSAFNGYVNTLTAFQTCMNALYYGNSVYCNSFKAVNQYVFQNFN